VIQKIEDPGGKLGNGNTLFFKDWDRAGTCHGRGHTPVQSKGGGGNRRGKVKMVGGGISHFGKGLLTGLPCQVNYGRGGGGKKERLTKLES